MHCMYVCTVRDQSYHGPYESAAAGEEPAGRPLRNLVVDSLGTHFPLYVHPVASPPRAGSWLILLDERIVAISE